MNEKEKKITKGISNITSCFTFQISPSCSLQVKRWEEIGKVNHVYPFRFFPLSLSFPVICLSLDCMQQERRIQKDLQSRKDKGKEEKKETDSKGKICPFLGISFLFILHLSFGRRFTRLTDSYFLLTSSIPLHYPFHLLDKHKYKRKEKQREKRQKCVCQKGERCIAEIFD